MRDDDDDNWFEEDQVDLIVPDVSKASFSLFVYTDHDEKKDKILLCEYGKIISGRVYEQKKDFYLLKRIFESMRSKLMPFAATYEIFEALSPDEYIGTEPCKFGMFPETILR